MPTERYFSLCELGDGEISSAVAVTMTTSGAPDYYDSTRARGAITVNGTAQFIETAPFVDAASATTFYTRQDLRHRGFGNYTGAYLEYVNSSGVVIFRLRVVGSIETFTAEYWNGSTYVSAGTFTFGASNRAKLAIKLVCGAASNVQIHLGGVAVLTAAINNAAVDNVAKVRYRTGNSSEVAYWSECAGANFDLRDLLIRTEPPTGNGTNTAWTGDYTAIDETGQDDTDLISSGTVGQRETYTHAAYTIPAGYAVESLWVTARGRVNGAGPVDAKFCLRSGGANYDSSALALGGALSSRARYWATDPATSVGFTQAGYTAVEFGAVSI